jgi:hypothetical protein
MIPVRIAPAYHVNLPNEPKTKQPGPEEGKDYADAVAKAHSRSRLVQQVGQRFLRSNCRTYATRHPRNPFGIRGIRGGLGFVFVLPLSRR